jgi:hypothetical protein
MKAPRAVIRGRAMLPDSAALHPGYKSILAITAIRRWRVSPLNANSQDQGLGRVCSKAATG